MNVLLDQEIPLPLPGFTHQVVSHLPALIDVPLNSSSNVCVKLPFGAQLGCGLADEPAGAGVAVGGVAVGVVGGVAVGVVGAVAVGVAVGAVAVGVAGLTTSCSLGRFLHTLFSSYAPNSVYVPA